jgi:hypothetical protein
MPDALPAVPPSPFRHELKDSVNRLTLLGGPVLNPRNQQLIDSGQPLTGLITLLSRSTGHCQPH